MSNIAKKTVTLIMSVIMAVTCIFAAGESTYAKAKLKKPAKPKITIKVNNPTWKEYDNNKNCGVYTISWKKSKNAKKYRLFEKKDGKWKALKIIKAKKNGSYKGVNYTVRIKNNKYTWKLTKSPLGKKRSFRIRAINGKKKVYSNIVSRKIAVPDAPPSIKTDVGTFVVGEEVTVTLGGSETRTMTVTEINESEDGDTVIEGKVDDIWGIWITVDKNGEMYLYRYAYWDDYYWCCPDFIFKKGGIILANDCMEPSSHLSVLWSDDGIEPVEGQEERTVTDPDTDKVYPLCGKVAYAEENPGLDQCLSYYPEKYIDVHKKLMDKVVIWYKVMSYNNIEYECYEVVK